MLYFQNYLIIEYIGKNNYLQLIINKKIIKSYLIKFNKKTRLQLLGISLEIIKLNFKLLKEKDKIYLCNIIATRGSLDCLKYAHENNCEWDKYTCSNAAKYGNLECLKYLHENGCPWGTYTCYNATQYNHLDCLKYAHINGCKWNFWVCFLATDYNHLDCLKYAYENNCPINKEKFIKLARKKNNLDCLNYLLNI